MILVTKFVKVKDFFLAVTLPFIPRCIAVLFYIQFKQTKIIRIKKEEKVLIRLSDRKYDKIINFRVFIFNPKKALHI
jgi:hypothetical protein